MRFTFTPSRCLCRLNAVLPVSARPPEFGSSPSVIEDGTIEHGAVDAVRTRNRTATQRKQTQSFSGTYALDHNRLVFTRADGIRMQAVMTSRGSEASQVRLTDTAPRDRELQFWK
jgi:hypothetical protein